MTLGTRLLARRLIGGMLIFLTVAALSYGNALLSQCGYEPMQPYLIELQCKKDWVIYWEYTAHPWQSNMIRQDGCFVVEAAPRPSMPANVKVPS